MYRYADHILYIYSLYLKSELQCDQKYDTMLPKILHGYYKNRKKSHETYFIKHILEKKPALEYWYHPKVKFHRFVGMYMYVNKADLKYFDAGESMHRYSFSAYQ